MKIFVILLVSFAAATSAAVVPTQSSKIVPMYELPLFLKKYPQLTKLTRVDGRITGGAESRPGQFPHMVGLFLHTDEGIGSCGATILSNEYVMTAAHCVLTEYCQDYDVILGAHHVVNASEPSQVRVAPIDCILHEDWDFDTLVGDIAILRIPRVEFNDRIQPIRLPTRSQQDNDFSDEMAVAAGWGLSSDSAVDKEEFLRYVVQPIISNPDCNLRYLGFVRPIHICMSGAGGSSTCRGDSGGSLSVAVNDGGIIQVGITSFGYGGGCELGWPAVFTRVTSHLDWISAKTNIPILP